MLLKILKGPTSKIVIIPITRRVFVHGAVREDFSDWRGKAIAASKDAGAKWLNLTRASTSYINAIGEHDSQEYSESAAIANKF